MKGPAAERPMKGQAAEQPTKCPAAERPIKDPAAERPIKDPAAERPIKDPAAERPIKDPAAERPIKDPAAERPIRDRQSGFTLLEMLVALVVFGLVMAGLTQTFRFGLSVWSAGPRKVAAPENLAALDAALTRMIGQAVPGSLIGHRDRLVFTTVLPAGAGLPGALADAAILPGPNGTLVLRYQAHPPGIPLLRLPPPMLETLASGLTAFSASYLTAQPSGAPVWASDWSGSGLPLLLRLHIQTGNAANWPDLVAATVNPGR